LIIHLSFLSKKRKKEEARINNFLCPHPTSPMPTMWELENNPKRLQVLSMWWTWSLIGRLLKGNGKLL